MHPTTTTIFFAWAAMAVYRSDWFERWIMGDFLFWLKGEVVEVVGAERVVKRVAVGSDNNSD